MLLCMYDSSILHALSPNIGRRLRSTLSHFLHLVLFETVSLSPIWEVMLLTLDQPILQFLILEYFLHIFPNLQLPIGPRSKMEKKEEEKVMEYRSNLRSTPYQQLVTHIEI